MGSKYDQCKSIFHIHDFCGENCAWRLLDREDFRTTAYGGAFPGGLSEMEVKHHPSGQLVRVSYLPGDDTLAVTLWLMIRLEELLEKRQHVAYVLEENSSANSKR